MTELCCPPLTGAVLDEIQAEELAALLKALADPVRIRLVSLVAAAPSGEVCACDLPVQLGRSQPTISHHLTQLVRAGILDREQRGRWAWFRLRPEQLAAVCAALGEPRRESQAAAGGRPADRGAHVGGSGAVAVSVSRRPSRYRPGEDLVE